MIKYLFIVIISCFNVLVYNAQEYFQQKVNTYINVELDDENHFLRGFERMVYHNYSNSNLDSIVIHLWPNAYKNSFTELAKQKYEDGSNQFKYASKKDLGFIDSLDFKINGSEIGWNYLNGKIDICVIHLKKPVQKGDSITITTPFRVKIPSGKFSRLGHVGQSYQVTQWFPKPAVYDKDGWHPISYLDQGEFYSEFGNYDVSITLPKNYILMATGDLQNEEEIDFLNEKAKLTSQLIKENKLPVRDSFGRKDMSFPNSSVEKKTLRFVQKNVHDFAWFTDKRYHILKGEVDVNNRKITSWALFTNNEAKLWRRSIEYINDATRYFSKWVGEYPYSHVTAVDGTISAGGGMEYPNITVIGNSGDSKSLETVIVHEVGHNWFYGILGSNERDNAWMDEGLNTYIEIRYMEEKYPYGYLQKKDSTQNKSRGISLNISLEEKELQHIAYQFNASRNYDQPLKMGSKDFTQMNYGAMVYCKTGIGFHYLKSYLGEALFDNCMNEYFNQWKFKHPNPDDIKVVFETASKENLDWFFEDYIKTTKKTDYSLKKISKINDQEYLIKLKNVTGYKSPIPIQMINDSNEIISEKWINGFQKDTTFVYKTSAKPSRIAIDYDVITTDYNYKNHMAKANGIFKFYKPIKFKFLPISINNNKENLIYYSPVIAGNAYDKTMVGLALYNSSINDKKVEWLVNPLYGFGSKKLVGSGKIQTNFNNNGLFPRIELGYKIRSFHNEHDNLYKEQRWTKQELFTDLRIKSKNLRSSPFQNVIIRIIRVDDFEPDGIFIFPPKPRRKTAYYGEIEYNLKSRQILKPKELKLNYVYGINEYTNLINCLQLTSKIEKSFNKSSDKIKWRFFAGYHFNQDISKQYSFYLSGKNGRTDYLYDNIYLGRNSSNQEYLFSRQNDNSYGGFKVMDSTLRSNNWMISNNFKIDIPKLPIGVFADFGMFQSYLSGNNIKWGYNAGIYTSIVVNEEIIGVYLPILYSDNIGGTLNELKVLQRISFIFDLENINPFTIKKTIKP
ncbi:M1 family metallopeptidase [Bacteroidota bacterium]|nr:M1 family metallopeptidase [Bacteroidota bacterium]